ncbi:hypothetical protein DVW05_06190 [Clostridium botulinum]|uniref:NACHT domain-containing protein n=1 Tax=Clostridium sp. ZBS18 TaxID=2949967 RepID=UPI001D5BBCFD|nr:hypothetical protein [Clostridium sp. ZBS18]MBN1054938.1 hypothetical protein [Clostridium botulinum]
MGLYNDSKKHTYNWKRYWYKRGEELNIENGFLKIQSNAYQNSKNNLITVDSLCNKGCLILLGDAGLGKSTVMAEEVKRLKNKLEEKNIMNVDLRSVSSDTRLDKLIFKKDIFINWMNGDYDLYLFLDSLDEGLLQVGTLAEILIENFKDVDISRLKLRIACRTGVLPSTFETKLKSLWKKENFDVFQLAFLSKKDIEMACKQWGYDSVKFLEAISYNNIEALASTPVTLEMLLRIYDVNGQMLPSSKIKLYEDGCRMLCDEVNPSRLEKGATRGNLSIDQRMEIATLLGAITMFCNKSNIVKGKSYDESEISIDEFLNITFKEYKFKLIDIEEVIGTALFTEKNNNVYSWAHLSYAEFLAAKFIQQNHFTKAQIVSLIFQAEDNNNRIIPQLHYTASWIASFLEEILLEIIEKDPDILCLSDISTISDRNKEKLVNALLNKYSSCYEYRRYGYQINFKKLNYDGLDIQLTKFIKDDKNNDDSKRIALQIAYECELRTMASEFIDLFIRNKFNAFYSHRNLNYEALRIFFKLSNKEQKKNSYKILDECLEDTEALYVIQNLYPDYISINDVIKIIKKCHFRVYKTFSGMEHILDCISVDDLIILMSEVEESTINKNFDNEVIDSILIYSWKYRNNDKIFKRWTRIACSRFEDLGTPLINTSINDNNKFIVSFKSEFQKRIIIIKSIWRKNIKTNFDDILNSKLVLINKDDLENILITAEKEIDKAFKDWLILLLLYMFRKDSLVTSENFRIMYEKLQLIKKDSKYIPLLKDEVLNLKLKLDNEKSKRAKYAWEEKATKDEISSIICNLKRDVIKYWPSCIDIMYEKYYFWLNNYEYSLTKSYGWKLLNEDEQELIIEATKEFLQKFNKNDFDSKDMSSPIIEAVQLVWEKCRDFIESWDSDMWDKIIDYVIDPNSSNYLNSLEYFKVAYKYSPQKVSNMLLNEMIKKRTIGAWYGSRQIAEDRIIFCQDSFLLNRMIDILSNCKMAFTSRRDLFNLIIEFREEQGLRYINNLIDSRYKNFFSCAVSVEAICSLMKQDPTGGENKIIPIIESGKKKEEKFMSIVLKRYFEDRPNFDFIDKWSTEGLCKLYYYLCITKWKKFDEDKWKEIIIDKFRDKKDIKSMSLIFKLSKEVPDCKYLKSLWEDMRDKYFRQIWTPPTGLMLVKMIENSKLTPITTEEQLLDLLMDSLQQFEGEMNYSETPLVELLWNTTKDTVIPKDEGALSNLLKNYLSYDLKNNGLIINREVEVFHNQGGIKGERLDIKVDLPCTKFGIKQMKVYIEVKGCWNEGLDTSMEEQLVKRYMINRKCDCGIYVIGWFDCNQWTLKKDTRRCPKYSFEDAKIKFNNQAKLLSQKYGVKVRAVVLDLSLK